MSRVVLRSTFANDFIQAVAVPRSFIGMLKLLSYDDNRYDDRYGTFIGTMIGTKLLSV